MLVTRLVLASMRFRQWLIAQFVFLLLGTLKLFPADGAIAFADRFTRWLGPKLKRRHRLTLTNLRNAFPEKSDAEINAIALESWGSMGRLAAEYVFLDKLFDFDPANPAPGRVEVEGIPLFVELRDDEGEVVLDFNRAFVPPCGFSAQYNCPLPPASNRFPLRIRAGEKNVVFRDGFDIYAV